FLGVWLDLPAGRLAERLAARRGGPSDATPSVLERQLGYELGVMDWQRVDAGPPPDEVAEAILRLIRSRADIPYG
ncbi:MAG: aminoglycoside phosphotransferase, partial [Rhodobacteraceae bacterium]|nr:aminoglycoside phosphotransferase [Paracoccaceae bacterium]